MATIPQVPIVIDISHHNVIPESLKPAKQFGIVGVIHKATEGETFQDDKVDAREWMCRDAGLLFGLYHFLRAGRSISRQVDNFLSVAKRYDSSGLLLALDYERGSDGLTPNLNEVKDWLQMVEDRTKVRPIIYSGNALKENLAGNPHDKLNQSNYRLWLAQYGTSYTLPAGWTSPWLWQYTDKGSCPGLQSPVDLNAASNPNTLVAEWQGTAQPVPVPPPAGLSLCAAIVMAKTGKNVSRADWNGKDMWVYYVPAEGRMQECLMFHTAQGTEVPWTASQTDLFATDWDVVK